MIKSVFTSSLLVLVLTAVLTACGGGGGGGGGGAPAGGGGVGGGGVKGPLALAIVTVYLYDATRPGFKGAMVATGSTNAAAAITGLTLPFPVMPPYIMEITSDAGTTDITTGMAPVITTLRTVITQALLQTGQQIYATPLTTMAVDIAVANSNAGTTPAQFTSALATAATQVVSTLGFGMPAAIDIFSVPPLIDATTDTPGEQAQVASYRTAIEALTAVAYQMQQLSGGSSTDAVLSELSGDLADGVIDGVLNGTPSTLLTGTTLNVLAQDPAMLPIPNTTPLLTVADVQAILVSEKSITGSTTPTPQLESGGSISTTPAPAQTDPDIDGDGVPNAADAFPEDPLESVDTDGDGIGDNSDPDIDGDGILNNDAPVIDAVGPFGIPESAPDGTPVGLVTATDSDSAVTNYSIEAGNTGAAFAISPGGAITVANTTAIDFEASDSFTLTVTATDGTATSAPRDIDISISNINDVAPVLAPAGPFTAFEGSFNGTLVGSVSATDIDSLVTGYQFISGNTGGAFGIDTNGQITVANNSILLANSPYTLTLTATDGTNNSAAQTVTINVSTSGAAWDSFNWNDGSTWQ